MAGATKAVLASLMFALLLSAGIVDAARPIATEGSASGSLTTSDAHSRQLRFFFGKCWFFCYKKYDYDYGYGKFFYGRKLKGDDEEKEVVSTDSASGSLTTRDAHSRQLRWFFRCWFFCYKKYDYDYGYGKFFYGRKLKGDDEEKEVVFYCGFWCKVKRFFFWWL